MHRVCHWWLALLVGATMWGAPTLTAQAAPRPTIDLMGEWYLLPLADAKAFGKPPSVPPTLPAKPGPTDWRKVTFPGQWHDGKAVAAWLVREIDLPVDLGRRTALLKFDSVGFAVRAYVNGIDCGSAISGYAPIEFDVRRALQPGRNVVQLAVTTYSQYPQLHATGIHVFQAGIVGMDMKKISLWQRARLELPPEVYVADVFVRPNTAKKRLYADVELVNTTNALAVVELTATVHPAEGGEPALRFPAEQVFLKVGERRSVTLEADWPNPRWWWPHDPYLYDLRVELRPAATANPGNAGQGANPGNPANAANAGDAAAKTGMPSDTTTVRFGFRDIVLRGIDLLLNGKKLVMRGDGYTRYEHIHSSKADARQVLDRWMKQRHINSLRLHVDAMEQYVLEAADEAGLLLLVQAPIGAGGGSITDRAAWDILTDMYLRYVKLSRNHPSVAIWGVANEAGGMRPDNPTPGSPFLAEKIRRTQRLDPTRPVTEAHDYTMLGAADLMDLPTQWQLGVENIFPFCCRKWIGYGYTLDPYRFDRPLVNDEWCEGRFSSGTALWFGDRAYICPDRGGDTRSYWSAWGQMMSCYMGMIEHRRQPYWGVLMCFGDRYGFFQVPPRTGGKYIDDPAMIEFGQKALKPAIVAPKDWNGGAWAGEPYVRPLVLMNDHFYDLQARLRWQVRDEQGQTLVQGQQDFTLPAVTHRDFDLKLAMPASDRPRAWQLHLELQDAQGRSLYTDSHDLGVLPRPKLDRFAPVVLWPQAGSWDRLSVERREGLRVEVSAQLPAKDKDRVVIVPRGVILTPSQWRQLEAWIRDGGTALILADRGLPNSFLGTELRPSGRAAAIGHLRRPEHPIVQGLPQPALRYWMGAAGEFDSIPYRKRMPHLLIAESALLRPIAGPSRTLIDSANYDQGGTSGLSQALLLEIPGGQGQGRALFCSLLLAEAMASDLGTGQRGEPAAAWLLDRCLTYLTQRKLWATDSTRPLYAVGWDLSPWQFATTDRLDAAAALVVNAASPAGADYLNQPQWLEYARRGGRVLLHRLSAEQIAGLAAKLNVPLQAVAVQNVHRLDLTGSDPLLAGISHYDVNWIECGGLDLVVARQPIVSVAVRATGDSVRVLTDPGAVALIPVGQGVVVIDQLLWDAEFASAELRRRASQYATQLLSNLGGSGSVVMHAIAADAPQVSDTTLALWHFEDDKNPDRLLDFGPRGLDLLPRQGARIAPGRFHQGLYLPGGKAHAGNSTYGLPTEEITYDFWIKPEGELAKSCGIIFSTYRSAHRADNSIVLQRNGLIGLSIGGGLTQNRTPIPADQWTHVTITISRKHQRTRFYLNDKLDVEHPFGWYYPHGRIAFGNPYPAEVDATLWHLAQSFRGTVDEFHLLSREWTPE